MKYPFIFWDSGGTIFNLVKKPEELAGFPSPENISEKASFRAGLTMKMFGHMPPPDLPLIIEKLHNYLSLRYAERYSMEMLAAMLYKHLKIRNTEEILLLADALAGPRYRSWLYEGVDKALSVLHKSGVRMGLIANTTLTGRMMRNVLIEVGLADFFESVICSCDLGIEKPDCRIFKTALASMTSSLSSKHPILYVGDSIKTDINGAVACGWDAALHLTSSENPQSKACLAFRDYNELISFVFEKSR